MISMPLLAFGRGKTSTRWSRQPSLKVWFLFLTRFSIASCALILISGCQGGSRFPESTVSGTIIYNKEPLDSGTITFLAENQATPSAQAMITDGKFTVKVPHGNKRVEIHSSKWTGKPYEEYGIKETIQYLPAKYNGSIWD